MAEHQTVSKARESRINEAVQFVDDEFQRVQKQLSARRKSLEKEFATKRKTVEKRTRKELRRIQSELKNNPIVKRADAVRKDVGKQVETRVDSLLGMMQLASLSDVQHLSKKLASLKRRIKEIEEVQLLAKSDAQRFDEKLTALNRRMKAVEDSHKTNGSSASI
jgi:predicted  nucleic acid-binding Zn-ribbon protein